MTGEGWVVVLGTRDRRRCAEAGLVLTALEIEHELAEAEGLWEISVPEEQAHRARTELAEYANEDLAPPVGARPVPELGDGLPGVAAYAGVLILVAGLTRFDAFGHDWLASGRIDSARVLAGEWWRVLTALTLHADPAHLAGNIVFGSFFGLYVGRFLGPGIGWAAIVAGGAAGNAVNVLIQPVRHLSIGASTAVFAALGLLVAYTWRRGFWKGTPWRTRVAPITAGLGLLAFTGTGSGVEGENVDILAHLTGFLSGFFLGAVMAQLTLPQTPHPQRLWGAIAAGSLALAWIAALS